MIARRQWLRGVAVAAAGAFVGGGRASLAQERAGIADTSNLFPMDQSAARPVRLPPKPGARPGMSVGERDRLEHMIRCQCGCTLAVYTCRTTDFSCQVSPAMHRDVVALVQGGYDAREILDAFVAVYGERALMAPPRRGFTLLAYVVPGVVLAVGAVVLAIVIRRWRAPQVAGGAPPLSATPDELARLEAAVRKDE